MMFRILRCYERLFAAAGANDRVRAHRHTTVRSNDGDIHQ
jgi:hypothetical protein